jgi:WD40 repeat protein
MTLAQRAWEIGQVPRTRRLLAAYEPLHHDREDLRGFEWFYLDRISNADGLRFSIPDGCRSVAVSPDGARIVWAFQAVCEVWPLESPPQRLFVFGANPADRHRAIVERVAYDPTGKHVATAAHDRTVKVWEAETGKLLHTLETGTDWAVGLRFSTNGGLLAACVGNERFAWKGGEIHVWDPATGKLKYSCKGHQGIAYDVSWSPDNDCFASAGHDQCVKIWSADDGKLLRTLGLPHGASARSVAFAPRGPLLAAGTSRGEVVIWDRDDWKERRILRGHVNWVHSVAFAPDGRSLATGGSDMLLRLWDAGNGQEVRTFRGHSSVIVDVAWIPKKLFVLSASMDQSIRGWNAVDNPEQFSIRSVNGNLAGFHLLPDGKNIAVAGQKAFLGIWDTTRPITLHSPSVRDHGLGMLWDSSLSPDGSNLAYTRCVENDDSKGGVFAWSFAHNEPRDLELKELHRGVRSVAHAADGNWLATGHRDGTVQIHDPSGMVQARTWQAHALPVHQVQFVPGQHARLLTIALDKTPVLWDSETGVEVMRFAGHTRSVRSGAFSNDGRWLATTSDDQTARIWDVATGKTLFRLEGHIAPVTCAAFSPNANRLVTGSDDFTLKIWDTKTGFETLTLRDHTLGIIQVAFAPDGRRVLSSAQDETVRVWNAGPVSDREWLRAAAAACRLTGISMDAKVPAGQDAQVRFELSNVSGKEHPTPPPRKSTVPYRTVLRVFAEPIRNGANDARSRINVGHFDYLPTTPVGPVYLFAANIPVNTRGLEAGKYRLRVEHGWLGDEIIPISEKVLEFAVEPTPKK